MEASPDSSKTLIVEVLLDRCFVQCTTAAITMFGICYYIENVHPLVTLILRQGEKRGHCLILATTLIEYFLLQKVCGHTK
jgi:hypothetical protein